MGKKRVVFKTGGEAVPVMESKITTTTASRKDKLKPKIEEGKVYISASYNNTIMTATDIKGRVITWTSAGALGFKGPKKSTPFAASKVAESLMAKIKDCGPLKAEVYVKGVGSGRESAIRSLATHGLEIVLIKDVTPIPHNGPKPPKPRRL